MANTDALFMDSAGRWAGNLVDENEFYQTRQRSDERFRESMGSGSGTGGTPPPTTGQLWPRGTTTE